MKPLFPARGVLANGLLSLVAIMGPALASAQDRYTPGVKTVVLVHGAWANGSSWSKVIPILSAKGLHVVAVELPLTSLADDVATTERALALEPGPLLLVGHSYGGAVITAAGNNPNVAGLLYVAAYAPDRGSRLSHWLTLIPPPWVPSFGPIHRTRFSSYPLKASGMTSRRTFLRRKS